MFVVCGGVAIDGVGFLHCVTSSLARGLATSLAILGMRDFARVDPTPATSLFYFLGEEE